MVEILSDPDPLSPTGNLLIQEQLEGYESVKQSVDDIIALIISQTANDRTRSPIQVTTLLDSVGNQFRIIRYNDETTRVAGISRFSSLDDNIQEPDAEKDGQGATNCHEDFLILQGEQAPALHAVTYDRAHEFTVGRQCTAEEAASLLGDLKDALKYQREEYEQRRRLLGRRSMSHAAALHSSH